MISKSVNKMNFISSTYNLIGNTPIVKLSGIQNNFANIFAKLEWYNLSSSIKDRMALRLIEDAEAQGRFEEGKIILEATSGNTGISLSMIAAMKGHPIEIVMPESVSIERRDIIKAYGAKLVLSPGSKGTGGAVELKLKMLSENPDKYVDINQFKDYANIEVHYDTTAKEILTQMAGDVDMVVLGIGTAGTGVGISKRLKEYRSDIQVVAVIPKLGVSIQGLRNPNELYPTQLYDSGHFDEVVEVSQDEMPNVFKTAQDIAKTDGLLVGMSSAAAMYIAQMKAKGLGPDKNIVVIFPDNGFKYLSTPLFKSE
ncbi:MAG: PLP-dependent cysteine synthase family protein [DPANN group archaeon]|nr:PLP-dependent cysteine synthase family protein [DPANN group archaeon]